MTVEQLLSDTTGLIIEGKVAEALDKINMGSENFPGNAQVRFMAGALSAQTENYDKAIEEYQTAIELEPNLQIARFQLGLLLVTLERNEQGEKVLRTIPQNENDFICCFATGLIHLLHGNNDAAKSCILRGVDLNMENASLNADMSNLLQRIDEAEAENINVVSPEDEIEMDDVADTDKASNISAASVATEDAPEESSDDDSSTHLLDVYKRH